MQRGVFYTPRPVVSFIVRSVDEILRTEFGLEDGLADITTWGEMLKRFPEIKLPKDTESKEPFVQILDPALGTGTFLVEVINIIHKTMTTKWQKVGCSISKQQQLWNEYVPKHLLPRLYGFELLMAPYAIAHMKIGLKLWETGYRFGSDERAHIYLTNSLEPPSDVQMDLPDLLPALAHEAHFVNTIKRHRRFTVIIGNPPYSGSSGNQGDWITNLLKSPLIEDIPAGHFYEVDNVPLKDLGEQNTRFLLDDYVKFLRYSQYCIARTNLGILGFITNHGYLDNPTFAGSRRSITKTMPLVNVLDLHGSLKKREKTPEGRNDENVFDIQPGVAIGIFRKSLNLSDRTCVSHADLWGSRETKFRYLMSTDFKDINWEMAAFARPSYIFKPITKALDKKFDQALDVRKVMPHFANCVITKRDAFVVDFDIGPLAQRIRDFYSDEVSLSELKERYGIQSNYEWDVAAARRKGKYESKRIIPYLYRPFDVRNLYYDEQIIARPTVKIVEHVNIDNPMLIVGRAGSAVGGQWNLAYVANSPVDWNIFRRGGGTTFPLYLKSNRLLKSIGIKVSNIAPTFISAFGEVLGMPITEDVDDLLLLGPRKIFHYIYAILHAISYRTRYEEFLKRDFPRIPLISNKNLFFSLSSIGADLVALHLLEDIYASASWNVSKPKGKSPLKHPITNLVGKNDMEVTKGFPRYLDGTVWINEEQGFKGVPEDVWNFHVGGYQVCEKWLKDRKGRRLTNDDIEHYQKIVTALNETIRLMGEISPGSPGVRSCNHTFPK